MENHPTACFHSDLRSPAEEATIRRSGATKATVRQKKGNCYDTKKDKSTAQHKKEIFKTVSSKTFAFTRCRRFTSANSRALPGAKKDAQSNRKGSRETIYGLSPANHQPDRASRPWTGFCCKASGTSQTPATHL